MVNNYFAGSTFTTPPASAPFGNPVWNAFRGPDFRQLDTGINKSFAVREGVRIQFRGEFFNMLVVAVGGEKVRLVLTGCGKVRRPLAGARGSEMYSCICDREGPTDWRPFSASDTVIAIFQVSFAGFS